MQKKFLVIIISDKFTYFERYFLLKFKPWMFCFQKKFVKLSRIRF